MSIRYKREINNLTIEKLNIKAGVTTTLRNHHLKPLSSWPLFVREKILGVFTDIDDTLTTSGAITNDALEALKELKEAGFIVIPITGRPVGWSLSPVSYTHLTLPTKRIV